MENKDNMDSKEPRDSLKAYTLEELSLIDLPVNLAGHPNEIEVEAGKDYYQQTVDNLTQLTGDLNELMEGEGYAFTGSMGMYSLWHDLMERKPDIDIKRILNQRIKGGKNDFDIAITEDRKEIVMTEKLKFDEDAKGKQRGVISDYMVDILVRPVIKGFPNTEISLGEHKVFTQNPVVGIFERMSALAYPQVGDDGKENPKEIKWGVDIKLLKLYVMLSEDLTEEELEDKLESMWNQYQEGKKYEYAEYLASQVRQGKDQKELLLPSICKLLNKDISAKDLQKEITEKFTWVDGKIFAVLLYTKDSDIFLENMKILIDLITPEQDGYKVMRKRAIENYNAISQD